MVEGDDIMDWKKIIETFIAMIPNIIIFLSVITSFLGVIVRLVKTNNKDINKVKDNAKELIEQAEKTIEYIKKQYEKSNVINIRLIESIKELFILNPELKGIDKFKELEKEIESNEEEKR